MRHLRMPMNKQSWEVRVVDNPEFINGLALTCSKCGSKDVNRASSIAEDDTEGKTGTQIGRAHV